MEVGVKWSFAGWSCFLHNILISLGWEKKKEIAFPCCSPGGAGGRQQVGVRGHLDWLFLAAPSGATAVFCTAPSAMQRAHY